MHCCRALAFGLAWLLVAAGCTTGSPVDLLVREAAQGTVYLDRLPDRQFQASHPIRLDQALIARSLQGVMIHEDTGLLRSLTANQKPTVPVFSGAEVAFLAPAIAEGLKLAASDQQVGFRLIQGSNGGYRERAGAGIGSSEPPLRHSSKETTSGHVFAYGRSLYISLTEYRQRPDDPDTVNMPNRRLPQPSGLLNRQVLFVPAEALRPDQFAPAFAEDPANVLIIDYDLLARLPAPSPTVSVTTPPAVRTPSSPALPLAQPTETDTDTDLRAIREDLKKKDSEVEELRKELQDIRRQLGEQPTNRNSAPSKPLLPARPAERLQ
ncbi:MAG: hypothetical protein ACXW34_04750 [Nitrospira sp.]